MVVACNRGTAAGNAGVNALCGRCRPPAPRCARCAGHAVSELTRRGTAAGHSGSQQRHQPALRGRYAVLAARDEVVTPQRVHDLMEREGS